jgi:hypothetical protein
MNKPRVEVIGDATLKVTAIYALIEWPSQEPRYVGKTTQYIVDRHTRHIRDAKRGGKRPVHYWLRKRIASGSVAIKLIEHVPAGADWAARERHWIEVFRAQGHNLLNLTSGGEGLAGHRFSDEHREKIATSLRRGANFSCLVCDCSFYRKPHEIKSGHNKFCSRACANKHQQEAKRAA